MTTCNNLDSTMEIRESNTSDNGTNEPIGRFGAYHNNMDEPIKSWKQLSQAQKNLQKSLNELVEAAIDVQRDYAVLLTKIATLFDPDIVKITSASLPTQKSDCTRPVPDEVTVDNLNKQWGAKFGEFDKIKKN